MIMVTCPYSPTAPAALVQGLLVSYRRDRRDQQVQQELKVNRVFRALADSKGLLAPKASPAQVAVMVKVALVLKVLVVSRVFQGMKGLKALVAHLALVARKGFRELKGQMAHLANQLSCSEVLRPKKIYRTVLTEVICGLRWTRMTAG
jgi:hypothetical protein